MTGFYLFSKMARQFLLGIFLSSILTNLLAQADLIINTEGVPPITTYTGEDYKGTNQVWDIIQDQRGLIYIATSYGLHEFDGENWRTIDGFESVVPRCFAMDDDGIIYLAGINIMGYLMPDSAGKTKFVSIANKLPKGVEIGRIEFVKYLNGKVHFAGWNSIAVYDINSDTIHHFQTDSRSYPNFILDNKMYYKVAGKGVKYFENDTLISALNGNLFDGLAISDFINISDKEVLGVSPKQQFYIYNLDTLYEKNYNLPIELSDKYLYKLNKLSKDYTAISYLSGGFLIVDKNWKPITHIYEDHGINQEGFNSFLDREGNLWLCTNYGLAVVELSSTYSVFSKNSGISGQVNDFEMMNGNIYVATTTGLFSKPWSNELSPVFGKSQKFSAIPNSDLYNDDILKGKGPLMVRAYTSVGQIKNEKYDKLFPRSETQSQLTYLKDSLRVLTVGPDGSDMLVFDLIKDNWVHTHTLSNDVLPERIYNLCYDELHDKVWGSNVESIFSFGLSEKPIGIIDYTSFGIEQGLPDSLYNWVMIINDELLISTSKGLFEFDYSQREFYKSDKFHNYFESKPLVNLFAQNDFTFWYLTQTNERGKIQVENSEVKANWRMAAVLSNNVNNVSWSEKGALFGLTNEIVYFQNDKEEDFGFKYSALVRQVDIISNQDTTLFHGTFINGDSSTGYSQNEIFQLKPSQNALRFSYSVPYYRHPEKRHYSHQLKGFEEDWSEWTDKTEKEYTNLPSGKYVFKVKARNGFLTESEIGTFEFVISKPWYFSFWIYLLYFALFIGLVYLIIYWNSHRLKKENVRLEEVIEERTSEIRAQKETIEKALAERESLLKEIHHRVKNNLQIIASLLYLQSGKFEDEDFKRVLEEGQGRVRSMALIHQKLYENDDLKSIPFGEYLVELIAEIKASFGQEMADIQINIESEEINFDVETAVPLGLIVNELATNAFKYAFFGSNKGSFSISLRKYENQYVLKISDNGRGIPDEIDIKKTKSLGLRLVKMLSVQLEGQYEFQSYQGTVFELKFVA